MATYLAFHEVDDVEHWLKSGKREEFFGPHGISCPAASISSAATPRRRNAPATATW